MTDIEMFEILQNDFEQWVIGVEEDDPLPLEIQNIFFVLKESGSAIELAYFGSEQKHVESSNFDYFPLEGQFYHNKDFFDMVNMVNCEKILILLVENALKNADFRKIFISRKIWLTFLHKKPFYKLLIK